MIDYVNEGLSEQEDMKEYIDLDSFEIRLVMEFSKDGTYKQYLNESALEDTLSNAKDAFKSGLTDYFEDYIDSLNLNITVEELLDASEVDLDELMEEAFGDKFVEEISKELESEGNFEVKDGKLFMSDGLDYDVEEDKYQVYEFDGDDLKIIEEVGFEDDEERDDVLEKLYPMVFKKLK